MGDGRSSLKFHLRLGGGAGEVLTRCVSSPGLHPFLLILLAPPPRPPCDRFPSLIRNDVDRSIVGINCPSLSCPANGHQFGTSGRQIIQPETQAPASPSLPLHPLPFSFLPLFSHPPLTIASFLVPHLSPAPHPQGNSPGQTPLSLASITCPPSHDALHFQCNSLWVGDPTRSGGAKGKPSA